MLLKLIRRLFEQREAPSTLLPGDAPATEPGPVETIDELLERARVALSQGSIAEAQTHLEEIVARGSDHPDATVMLAGMRAEQGQLVAAESGLRTFLARHPDDPHVRNALGNVLRMQGKPDAALDEYDRVLAVLPDFAGCLTNRALCLQDLGRFAAAEIDYRHAVDIDPGDLEAATSLAALESDLGRDEAACARLDTVLQKNPGFTRAHCVKAFSFLRRGNYEQGWREYEWRDRDSGRSLPSPHLPEWTGGPLTAGPLLVCAEQGLGDQIMFASCLDDLAPLVDACIVECDPRLVRLFSRSFPNAHVYPHLKKAAQPWLNDGIAPCAKTWIGSLPSHLRTGRAAFPDRERYLVANPVRVEYWRTRLAELGPGLKVGISWRGGTPSTRRTSRSIPLCEWQPLLKQPDIHFVDLQYGEHSMERTDVCRHAGIRLNHWPEALTSDYEETAALVEAIDLVISVQTAVVHLAGALGKPAWVLVSRFPEWRYGVCGSSMPWYPSVRLFRQSTEDWTGTLAEAGTELSRWRDQFRHSAGTYL